MHARWLVEMACWVVLPRHRQRPPLSRRRLRPPLPHPLCNKLGWHFDTDCASLAHDTQASTQAAQAVPSSLRRECTTANPPGPCSAAIRRLSAIASAAAGGRPAACAARSRRRLRAPAADRHSTSRRSSRRWRISLAALRPATSRLAIRPLRHARWMRKVCVCFSTPRAEYGSQARPPIRHAQTHLACAWMQVAAAARRCRRSISQTNAAALSAASSSACFSAAPAGSGLASC